MANKLLKTLNSKLISIGKLTTTGTPPNEITTGYYNFVKLGYIEDIQRLNKESEYPCLLCIVPTFTGYNRNDTFSYTKFSLTFYIGKTWNKESDNEFEMYDDIMATFKSFINDLSNDAKFEVTGIDTMQVATVPEGVTKDFALFCKTDITIKFFKDA